MIEDCEINFIAKLTLEEMRDEYGEIYDMIISELQYDDKSILLLNMLSDFNLLNERLDDFIRSAAKPQNAL